MRATPSHSTRLATSDQSGSRAAPRVTNDERGRNGDLDRIGFILLDDAAGALR
jgi:hypothetical protein